MEQVKTDKKRIALYCLASAGLAGVTFCVFCIIQGITPFGENSILRNDAIVQYAPFLANYIEKIKTGTLSLWSWNLGGGVNEYGLVAYYLLSPFNLLALPFNASNIGTAFWLIILVKTAFIALTASYYFQKKFNETNILSVVFPLIYTFSGFYLVYYYNTMWLYALIMLPLIALGIENIVNGKKATLYFVALTYAIFVNFYIGYMICIFSVLYFFYLLFAKDVTTKETKEDELPIMQVMVKYGFASLLAGLVCAVVILPVLYAISNSSNRSDFTTTEAFFNFFDFLSYHITGIQPVQIEMTTQTAPYLMSSMLTLLSAPAFFCLKNVKANKKIATAVVLVIFYLSFAIPKMNYFWHGFSAPTFLPYRFSFIYLLFIITLAYELVKNIKELPAWGFEVSAVFAATAVAYAKLSQFSDHIQSRAIILSAFAAVVVLALLILARFEKLSKKALSCALSVVIVAELVLGNYYNVQTALDSADIHKDNSEIEAAVSYIQSDDSTGPNRMEINDNSYHIMTYAALHNYNSLSTFSSLSDTQYSITQATLGNYGNLLNGSKYVLQTPIYNALFSLNYILDTAGLIEDDGLYYEKVSDIGENGTLYKVKYSLPLGFCVNKNIEKFDPYNYVSTVLQGNLWEYVTGVLEVFDYMSPTQVGYNGCKAVSSEEISKFIEENATETETQEHAHDHEHDDHDHDHEGEDTLNTLSDNQTVQQFDLSAENLGQILDAVGGVYSFKADKDDFSVDFKLKAENDSELFALVDSGSMQSLVITRADSSTKEIDVSERHICDLGYYNAGEELTLTVCKPDRPLSEYDAEYPLTDSIQMSVASINEEKFLEGYNKILENGVLNIEEFEDTHIYGTVNSTVDGYMMMPMPYDLGWTIWVDGEEVEPYEHESHIMMFPISTGEHTVEMKYFPQGLKEGIFVSLAAILGLVLVLLLGKVHKMKLELEAEEAKENAEKAEEAAEVKATEAESNANETDSGKKEE